MSLLSIEYYYYYCYYFKILRKIQIDSSTGTAATARIIQVLKFSLSLSTFTFSSLSLRLRIRLLSETHFSIFSGEANAPQISTHLPRFTPKRRLIKPFKRQPKKADPKRKNVSIRRCVCELGALEAHIDIRAPAMGRNRNPGRFAHSHYPLPPLNLHHFSPSDQAQDQIFSQAHNNDDNGLRH